VYLVLAKSDNAVQLGEYLWLGSGIHVEYVCDAQVTHSASYIGSRSNMRVHTTTRKAAGRRRVIRWWAQRSTSARRWDVWTRTRSIGKLSLDHYSQLCLLPVHSANSAVVLLRRVASKWQLRQPFVFLWQIGGHP